MTRTYTITRGNQYDGDQGYSIDCDEAYGWGRIAMRMDGTVGITFDGGVCRPSDTSDAAIVKQAIMAVLADGITRTVTIGEPQIESAEVPEWRSTRGLSLDEEMSRDDTIY